MKKKKKLFQGEKQGLGGLNLKQTKANQKQTKTPQKNN